ncbi:hypothetical protein Q673_01335 [Marinobacter sp. EN3]|nr:hypothetical protein Q673_01335 [Marinobacter sp. EN3]
MLPQNRVITRESAHLKKLRIPEDQQVRFEPGSIQAFNQLEELALSTSIGITEVVDNKENGLRCGIH